VVTEASSFCCIAPELIDQNYSMCDGDIKNKIKPMSDGRGNVRGK
jgi:hypothetical protein